MLRLYGSAKSRAVRVLWMAGELGLTYDHKDWLPRAPETRTPEYRALNPNSRVPTIDDDGFVLSESMAINFYLAKKHKSPLYPTDPKQEALALQWSLWETDRLDRQIVNYCRHTRDLPEAERKPDIAEAAWKEIVPAFDALEAALAKSAWLAGPAFSLGDLNVAAALFRALALDLAKWPHVNTWLHRCWERPAAKKVRAICENSRNRSRPVCQVSLSRSV
jgi:glutathione S-transferase